MQPGTAILTAVVGWASALIRPSTSASVVGGVEGSAAVAVEAFAAVFAADVKPSSAGPYCGPVDGSKYPVVLSAEQVQYRLLRHNLSHDEKPLP
jgi:hypothetical protein